MNKLVPVIAPALRLTGGAAIRANETYWTEQLLTAEELARLQTVKR